MSSEMLEIFSWLPAKSIFKFAAVCKEANHLVSEDYFIEKQYRNLKSKDDDLGFFLQPKCSQIYPPDKLELHSLHANGVTASHRDLIPPKSFKFLNSARTSVLASSNGLLCCRNLNKLDGEESCDLFLCNPATQSCLPIPSPSGLEISRDKDLHIVFECNNADYMLTMLMQDVSEWSSRFQLKVYLPEEGIWKDDGSLVNFGGRNINLQEPVYHNGTVHYLSDWGACYAKGSPFYWPYVVCLSINDGAVKFSSVPKSSRKGLHDVNCRLGIFKWGASSTSSKSICLVKVARKRCCVWVLADYDSSSWTRILKMRVRAMGFIEDSPIVCSFTVLNGESLLLATDDRVYRYNLASRNKGKVELICSRECGGNDVLFHSYSSTLRPCGRGAAAVPVFYNSLQQSNIYLVQKPKILPREHPKF